MNNFENLANTPGVIHRRFCTFCPEEATGELKMPVEDDFVPVPVCEPCANKVLDMAQDRMV